MTQDSEQPGKAPESPDAAGRPGEAAESAGTAQAEAAAAPPEGRRGFLFLGAVAVIALIAVGVVAGWPVLRREMGYLTESEAHDGDIQMLQDDVIRLRNDFAALPDRLAALERDMGARPDAIGQLDELARRLAALEAARPAAADPRQVAQLAQENERLAAEVQRLGQALEAVRKGAADANAVLKLAERIDGVDAAQRQAAADRGNAQALLLAVGQLRGAVDAGRSFDVELRAVKVLAPDAAAALEPLTAKAATGIPTRPSLRDSFDAAAAKAAQAAVVPATGWVGQTVQRLSALVTVRRIDGAAVGDDAQSVLARAGARLAADDLAGAVAETAALTGAPAEAMASWRADAEARLTADKTLSELAANAVAVAANRRG